MQSEEYELKLAELKFKLKKKDARIKFLNEEIELQKREIEIKDMMYERLCVQHEKLNNKFEANFKFHDYIKNVLDETADLMENVDAVRE